MGRFVIFSSSDGLRQPARCPSHLVPPPRACILFVCEPISRPFIGQPVLVDQVFSSMAQVSPDYSTYTILLFLARPYVRHWLTLLIVAGFMAVVAKPSDTADELAAVDKKAI